MKVIITEIQKKLILEDEDVVFLIKKKAAKKNLTKLFGNLTQVRTRSKYDEYAISYLDKTNKIILKYDWAYLEYGTQDIWRRLIDAFEFDRDDVDQIVKEWFEENYKLPVKSVNKSIFGWYYGSLGQAD